jgi:hypothetical protein
MALAFCWQIALIGLAIYGLFLIVLWFLSYRMRNGMKKLQEVDDSAKVNFKYEIL